MTKPMRFSGRRQTRPVDGRLEPLEPRQLLSASLLDTLTTTASGAMATLPSVIVSAAAPGGSGVAAHTAINLSGFRADTRFSGYMGQGFTSVIIDTGINSAHPFFGADANGDGVGDRIVYQYDFTNNGAIATDVNGHGSHVASLVAGGSTQYPGVAPGASIIALKVMGANGSGSFAAIEQALQWVVAHVTQYNIVSVNMSLGDGANTTTRLQRYGIGDELAALANQRVIVAAAAGNAYGSFQTQGLSYPASDPNSIAVGATFSGNFGSASFSGGAVAYSTAVDLITPFSQRSAGMEIFAPGAFLVGAAGTGSGTVSMAGTSMASPIIAGVAVLAQQVAMASLGRRLTIAEFRQVLTSTADVINDGDNENDSVTNTGLNYKRVNVLAMASAIAAMAGPVTPPPPAPPAPPTPPAPPAPPTPPFNTPGVNDAPIMTQANAISITTRLAKASISHAMIAAAGNEVDPDGDVMAFEVTLLNGRGTFNGRTVRSTFVLGAGKAFTWTAPARSGTWTALRVRAVDPSGAKSGFVDVVIRWNVAGGASSVSVTSGAFDAAALGVGLRLSLSDAGTPSTTHASAHRFDFRSLAADVMGASSALFVS